MLVSVRWLTAFLDTPRDASGAAESVEFWQQVTRTRLSPSRGEHQEFATLLQSEGDAFLRTQEIGAGRPGCHLDLHVEDVPAAAGEAVRSGAHVVADLGTLVVTRSPAGLPVCFVPHRGEARRPPPVSVPAGDGAGTFSTLVDQLSIDVPTGAFEAEVAWWSRLTGWRRREGIRPEFAFLDRPPGLPLRLLFQRLPDRTVDEAATAHLDLACTDRPAEVARHLDLGATALRHTDWWDTMIDPVGRPYCITDRDPTSGRLAQ